MTVAKARNTARQPMMQDKPRAPDLPQPERGPSAGATADHPIVVDNLPEVIPVAGPELDVIETYLGNLIDRLLMDAASDRTATPASAFNPEMLIRASRPRS
jgi:hypothetical protein